MSFPHGFCECGSGVAEPEGELMDMLKDVGITTGCCMGVGPAMLEATRGTKRMRLCTRCVLSTDTEIVSLIQQDEVVSVYMEFDKLGMIWLGLGVGTGKIGEASDDADP